jgi:hypothetical protein
MVVAADLHAVQGALDGAPASGEMSMGQWRG